MPSSRSRRLAALSLAAISSAALAGCQAAAPPPRVAVPSSPEDGPVKTYAPLRPLREPSAMDGVPPPAFDDVPLVTQATPEQTAYVGAYDRVGRPRVAVFVNRTLEGTLVPVEPRRDLVGVEVTRQADSAVEIETSRGGYRSRAADRFKTDGPASVRESAVVYLAPGQYDEASAKAIDYEALELALADVLAAGGKVTLVSPTMARQRLTDAEVKDLQAGRPTALREIAGKLDADVLVQVQARPTKQTSQGLGVRVLVEAIDTRGGESLARSFVDVPPPLDKPTINRHARFLARKTMYALAGSWTTMADEPPAVETPREPSTQPR